MKNITINLFFLLFFSLTISAKEVSIGVIGGINRSILSGTINQNPNYKTGFHFGGNSKIELSEYFSYKLQLSFSQQGCFNNYEFHYRYHEGGKTTMYLSYINIQPIVMKIYPAKNEGRFSIDAGIQIGMLLNAKEKGKIMDTLGSFGTPSLSSQIDTNITSIFKNPDFALVLGISYEFKMGLEIGVSANYGIVDINADSTMERIRESIRQKTNTKIIPLANRVIQFSIGYNFKVHKKNSSIPHLQTTSVG